MLTVLGDAANRMVAKNAQKLARISDAGMTPEQRAQRPWDIPAKMQVAQRIKQEELDRSFATPGDGPPHNDMRDAMRHARWSQRTAQAAGPIFAEAAGIAHEADNLVDSLAKHRRIIGPYEHAGEPGMPPTPAETLKETLMDLRNNTEGRRAARQHQAIDPQKLQTSPADRR